MNLADMTRAQLDVYAANQGIDTSKARSKSDVIGLIEESWKSSESGETGAA